ncbi:hypothetical protein Slin15195_G056690 [Septoria linicola]|uniref:DUF8035 domain-containing protein n=1 Tax=Septoria linicola TaxID=215465 RepID=A0A9Q9EIT3_9PEZI|nr:hypothetical protein Slin14017_G072570 [Septoria linicola]USW52350.1 hypothetical protein Slin15195_G056690 [Septoria linicola]
MEQSRTSAYTGGLVPSLSRSNSTTTNNLKRPRPGSLSIQVPRVKPIAQLTMSYNHRPLSPGGRRLTNPARASDNTLTSDGYYSQRHNTYASPRSSTGVIPISTQTFINVPQAQPAPAARLHVDSYSGRPRRSSHADQTRGTTASSSTTALPSRTRPNIIQQEVTRPASPTKITPRDIYVTPASSQEPRVSTTTHKKLYSVDGDGSTKLVADVNIPASGDRHHRRRDSVERGGYRTTGVERERERGRRGATYHTNGSHNRPRDQSIDDEDAYSYTDPASMYRDTEPRWREVQRPRRGSVDRGGATSRERPVSLIDPSFGQRQPAKEAGGPPPSTRGWDKINENLGRTTSVRDAPRPVAQSPTRGRHAGYADYGDPADAIYAAPRNSSTEGRRTTIHNYDSNYDYTREPRTTTRRHSVTRRPDESVERRGFGINPNLRDDSQTRYGRPTGRGSDENFERTVYRDSGHGEPVRRDTASQPYTAHHHDTARLDQEKRDRDYALRLQAEDHDRQREREVREPAPKLPSRRDDDRGYDRDYERPREREHDRLTERERERERYMQPPSERKDDRKDDRRDERKEDRERHHTRRDTTDREREYGRKKDKDDSPRQSGDTVSKPSLSQAATGGLAGAAAAFGLTGLLNKVSTDKRDKDKDRDESRDRGERERDRSRDRRADRDRPERGDRERDRDRPRERPDRFEDERERHRDERERKEPARAASDEEPYGRERERERDRTHRDTDRGLGFAFEAPPEPSRTAPPPSSDRQQGPYPPPDRAPTERGQDKPAERQTERPQDRLAPVPPPERPSSRQGERSHGRPDADRTRDSDSDSKNGRPDKTASAVSAEEDYRRRMEQVQRELGVASNAQRPEELDPDRERRRREREQRQRDREMRNGSVSAGYPDSSSGSTAAAPAGPTRRSFERDDVSNVTGMTGTSAHDSVLPELHRKPSILDRPMTDEPYQIIDNSQSDRRENRVRIVDPPTEAEDRRPKGILKKPTEKFPEDNNAIREGVAPLKDATKKGIPPGARWTKIDRRLVNPEALEASQERFEERLDCVIVLRVLTKEEIQKLADKTRDIRDKRYEEERSERKAVARKSNRNRDRHERDEYEYSDSEDEFKEKAPKMLEAPSTAGPSSEADFIREHQRRHDRNREVEPNYNMSGGLGVRDDGRRREESRSRY